MYVTRPELPEFDDFAALMRQVWESRILTNGGPIHERLEAELAIYLGVKYVCLMNNGTMALLLALHAFGLQPGDEVITTPYSFVATAHAVDWNGLRPVFADIDPDSCCLSPEAAERCITERTRAILPVHVYGRPCAVEAFQALGQKYGLPVIYDAAHAFGTLYQGRSLTAWGDMAVLSFHATKVYNTIEGGAVVCHTPEMKTRLDRMRNFGFHGEMHMDAPALNAKMDEMHAAVGVLNLRRVDADIAQRRELCDIYRRELVGAEGISLLAEPAETRLNGSHMPIFLPPGRRNRVWQALRGEQIFARRYFYPLITDFEPYRTMLGHQGREVPQAAKKTASVLCLPLFPAMTGEDVEKVVRVVRTTF